MDYSLHISYQFPKFKLILLMVLDIIILMLMVLCHSQIKTRKQQYKNAIVCQNTQETVRELNVRTYVDIHWQMAFCNLSLSIFH